MKKGDRIYTPRFCSLVIEKVFRSQEAARKCGYTEPTYYKSDEYEIFGKIIGLNRLLFAAVKL